MNAPSAWGLDGAELRRRLTAAAHAHPGDELGARAAAVLILKELLGSSRETIEGRLLAGASGLETVESLSSLADEIITALFDFITTHIARSRNPTRGEQFAVCAVGGYGRGRLAPGSDWDLMFLLDWKQTAWSESVMEHMLYALWDLGVQVGYSVRSLEHAVRIGFQDWTALTAMADLRFLSGNPNVAAHLSWRLREENLKHRAREFMAAKLAERSARIATQNHQTAFFMVEPDVKEGDGGLRDLQTLEWLAKARAAASGDKASLPELLVGDEPQRAQAAAEFLWRVRSLLHVRSGRAQDRLSFDLQEKIAHLMGETSSEPGVAAENFMRRYFLNARDVRSLLQAVRARVEADAPEKGSSGLFSLGRRERAMPTDDPRFEIVGGRVRFSAVCSDDPEPSDILSLFREAARQGVEPHPDAMATARRGRARFDDAARADAACADIFFACLTDADLVDRSLKWMNEAGVLGAYIPEFDDIVARTQFNMFHHFTVDEHILRVVSSLAAFERGPRDIDDGFAHTVFSKVTSRRALYFAALMHDTGKGAGDQEIEGAKRTRSAGARLGLSAGETELAAWLVSVHLVMSDTAQRRDLSDPRTMTEFITQVEAPERLRLLTLLTLADMDGVGPGVLTVWKARLIRDLYELSEAVLRGGRSGAEAVRAAVRARANEGRDAALSVAKSDEERDLLTDLADALDDAYWLGFDPNQHARQLEFALNLMRTRAKMDCVAVWAPELGAVEVIVYAPDSPGVFARVSHALAYAGGDVRSARAYATRDEGAFDVFVVELAGGTSPDAGELAHLREQVLEAARGDATPDVGARIALHPKRAAAFDIAPSVVFDDSAGDGASIIEVSGRDRPGLLAELATTLVDTKLDVRSAHVVTRGALALDVFYVTEEGGGPVLSASRQGEVQARLLASLEAGASPP